MKKIINGRKYNTETARVLGGTSHGYPSDFGFWCEELHQKRTGEFFIHGVGGPYSKYARYCGQNQWAGGEEIIPLAPEEARQWSEKYLTAEEYEEIFGACEE